MKSRKGKDWKALHTERPIISFPACFSLVPFLIVRPHHKGILILSHLILVPLWFWYIPHSQVTTAHNWVRERWIVKSSQLLRVLHGTSWATSRSPALMFGRSVSALYSSGYNLVTVGGAELLSTCHCKVT
jgi:hypothetical protein